MVSLIIITVCSLLLLAYVFEISSTLTKIPSVLLLLVLGWIVRQATSFLNFQLPDLNPLLPILGTIGLILIVLEGSLELEMNKSKLPVIVKSSLNALIPMLVMAFLLTWTFQYIGKTSFKTSLINAIPICVISSAIAIPSVRNLSLYHKEFITYESSFSDIFGVLFFNFVAMNEFITSQSFGLFALQLLIILTISFF